jgi:hypothetical protein
MRSWSVGLAKRALFAEIEGEPDGEEQVAKLLGKLALMLRNFWPRYSGTKTNLEGGISRTTRDI